MTTLERIEARAKELRHAIRFYDDLGWDDLANEYRTRLDEMVQLLRVQQPETEAELRYAFGDR